MVGKVLIFQNDKCKNISAPSPCSQGCETGYSMALYCWMPGEKTSTLLLVSSRSQGSVLIIFSQNFKVAQRESSTLWTTDKKQFNLLLGLTLVVVETQHQLNLTELIVWHYYWLLTPTTIRSHQNLSINSPGDNFHFFGTDLKLSTAQILSQVG